MTSTGAPELRDVRTPGDADAHLTSLREDEVSQNTCFYKFILEDRIAHDAKNSRVLLMLECWRFL